MRISAHKSSFIIPILVLILPILSHGFHIFLSERLGAKFTQQTNFISELERLVPKFYGETGANLATWVRKAPQIKSERSSGEDVSPSGIAEDAEDFGT